MNKKSPPTYACMHMCICVHVCLCMCVYVYLPSSVAVHLIFKTGSFVEPGAY